MTLDDNARARARKEMRSYQIGLGLVFRREKWQEPVLEHF